jgi:uroporphyrinogen-III synthase
MEYLYSFGAVMVIAWIGATITWILTPKDPNTSEEEKRLAAARKADEAKAATVASTAPADALTATADNAKNAANGVASVSTVLAATIKEVPYKVEKAPVSTLMVNIKKHGFDVEDF